MNKRLLVSVISITTVLATISGAEAKNFVKDSSKKAKLGDGSVGDQSGLQYKDLRIGKGATPKRGQTVEIHYTGWLYPSGKKIDSSVDRKIPFRFAYGTSQVMKGWNIGMTNMKVGGKRMILIPPQLGHGKKRVGPIPANSTLKYEIELLRIF